MNEQRHMNQSPTTNESSPRILASIGFSLSISLIGPDSASNASDAEDYIWENRETWKNELKKEIDEELTAKYGQDVYSEVIRLERGSIIAQVVLVLAVGVAIYEFLSKYKDFYESVSLLKLESRPSLRK